MLRRVLENKLYSLKSKWGLSRVILKLKKKKSKEVTTVEAFEFEKILEEILILLLRKDKEIPGRI